MTKLLGTAPNQAPTNADLGDLAYQNGDNCKIGPITIDGSGNVGIGTTAPDGTLHVHTASAGAVTANAAADDLVIENDASGGLSILTPSTAAGFIMFGDESSNSSGQIAYNHSANAMQFLTLSSERARIDSGGNFVIGNSTATNLLDVFTTPSAGGSEGLTVRDGTRSFQFGQTGSTYSYNGVGASENLIYASGNTLRFLADGQAIAFNAGTAERMRITSAGLVGIGTSAPVQKLELNEDTTSGGPYFQFENRGTGTTDNTNTYNVGGMIAAGYRDSSNPSNIASIMFERAPFSGGASSTGSIVFGAMANGTTGIPTERMRLDSNGRLGIGTTSPDFPLDVAGRIGILEGTNGIAFHDGSGSVSGAVRADSGDNLIFATGSSDTERMRIDSSGNLLIGTTTAGASKLVVADDSIQINTAKTPASAAATGTTGEFAWDASYFYICTATNTWRRVAHATW